MISLVHCVNKICKIKTILKDEFKGKLFIFTYVATILIVFY